MSGPRRLRAGPAGNFGSTVAASETPLWSEAAAGEQALQRGKVQNLRVAARELDGLVIPAGALFSFWRQVGPPTARRGFAPGRMLRQGCVSPAVGGGLCQLSNALYAVALDAGCQIAERHPHSRIIPGSLAAQGRDATVAWNYVDLRFVAPRELRLTARLDKNRLMVALAARSAAASRQSSFADQQVPTSVARDCGSCGETACHRHRQAARIGAGSSRRAFLVDEAWSEFREYVTAERRPGDAFGAPLVGAGPLAKRGGWSAEGFDHAFGAPFTALRRGLSVRRAESGAARRRAELASAEAIAARFARRLTPDVTAVTVAQGLLPFLWRDGHLGGRAFTVLMTRPPAEILHARLDAAFAAHPEWASLSDFRWPEAMVRAEAEALAAADRIVTPHAEIADLFGARAVRLEWSGDAPREAPKPRPIRCIGFPGPTIARKGAHAVREAARALDLEVALFGTELEGEGFWRGVRTRSVRDWSGVDAVVQPALAEEQPRRLISALAAGLPVFATAACGLAPRPGLRLIPFDDPAALIAALEG